VLEHGRTAPRRVVLSVFAPSIARSTVRRHLSQLWRPTPAATEGNLSRDISRAMVNLFQASVGRGQDATGTIERLTGQRVEAFLSDHDVDEDIVIEAFVLESGSTSGV
jgi:hypothetical protein